ncbi:hypothetical protein ACIBTZ_10065 [Micromonospora sp. NPDC049460]|uniref:hypothetical protein n=1 Tax=Micromonospora sp. NPDC049460 TaxID=3364272 RepID=UPI0037AF3A6D
MTVLTTERLFVREWTTDPADLARIFDLYSRAEVTRWLNAPGLPLTGNSPPAPGRSTRSWRPATRRRWRWPAGSA